MQTSSASASLHFAALDAACPSTRCMRDATELQRCAWLPLCMYEECGEAEYGMAQGKGGTSAASKAGAMELGTRAKNMEQR